MANRYWVGGQGNVSAANAYGWSATDGGLGGASAPGPSDDVVFTERNATTWAASTAYSSAFGTVYGYCSPVTLNGWIYACTVSGTSGIVEPAWPTTLNSTVTDGAATWRCVARSIGYAGSYTYKSFNGSAFTGSFSSLGLTLNGDFSLGSSTTLTGSISLTFKGAVTQHLTTGGKWVAGITINNASGTLQLLDALVVGNQAQGYNGALTRTAGAFDANGKSVTIYTTSTYPFTGDFSGSSSFYDLTVYQYRTTNLLRVFAPIFALTVTNNLKLAPYNGAPATRLFVKSDVFGTARTITCNGTVTADYCDFEDISSAGSASWDISAAAGGSGNCGGNTGITFSTPVTSYLVGSGNRTFLTATWASSSGGTAGTGRFPLPQDTTRLDAATGSGIINLDSVKVGSLDCSGFSGTLSGSTAFTTYGTVTLSSGMTLSVSQLLTFGGRGSNTLTSSGKSWTGGVTLSAFGGTLTLGDPLTIPTGVALTITYGAFITANNNVSIGSFASTGTTARSISLGSSVVTFTSTVGTLWNTGVVTGLTLNAGTSKLLLSAIARTSAYTLSLGGLTYYDFEDATSSGTGALTINSSNTFNQFKVAAGRTIKFKVGSTCTAADWALSGTAGNLITITSQTSGQITYLAKSGGGTVNLDYVSVSSVTVSPAATFYAGSHSTDGGNNSGWTFSALSLGGNNIFFGSNF